MSAPALHTRRNEVTAGQVEIIRFRIVGACYEKIAPCASAQNGARQVERRYLYIIFDEQSSSVEARRIVIITSM
jgi:hypothetical protein